VSPLLRICPGAIKEKDKFGCTPLYLACRYSAPFEMILLLFNTWLGEKENRNGSNSMDVDALGKYASNSKTKDVKKLFGYASALYKNDTTNSSISLNEIMNYFISIELWNGVTLVFERHPTVIKSMHLDTNVMAHFLFMVWRCCSLTTMWEVICNEQDLLEGI